MKYAFMTFSTPTLTLDEVLAVARKYGYDGVEFRCDAQHAHGIEVGATSAERATARQTIAASGIAACCLATSLRFADPTNAEQMVADALERIDLAGDLGIPTMRVFGGGFPAEMSRDAAVQQVAGCLSRLAERTAVRGVRICLETHDSWCDPVHVAAILSTVNHPYICCNWDVMHPVRGGFATVEESFAILQPWIYHTHLHDGITENGQLRMVPIGQGAIDHRAFVKCLQKANYQGYLSGEWIGWEPYDVHLPRELATLKSYA